MGKKVKIKADYSGALMPDGRLYGAGQEVILTDAEYAALPVALLQAITLSASGLADPVRTSAPASSNTVNYLLLNATDPVPAGTPAKTLIYRTGT